ncbi:MAG: hypothetical protein IPJ90_14220 [Anaerolineaceae bacterium]|nr:hypothetical protein [Anaerolineaceae bacterium]
MPFDDSFGLNAGDFNWLLLGADGYLSDFLPGAFYSDGLGFDGESLPPQAARSSTASSKNKMARLVYGFMMGSFNENLSDKDLAFWCIHFAVERRPFPQFVLCFMVKKRKVKSGA